MKIKRILLVATVALSATFALSSCIKETFPKTGAITENQLLTGEPSTVLECLLPGIHSNMLGMCYSSDMHSDYGQFSMGVFHDYEAHIITNHGEPLYNHFNFAMWGNGYAPNGTMGHFTWYRYYPQIKSCNQIIDIVNQNGGDEQYPKYAGVAKTFRAMFYLDLARLFEPMLADAPEIPEYNDLVFDVIGLTVPYVDENTTEESAKNNPRATREEMFTRIFADLADAEKCLSEYARANASEPNLAVVYGLYARAYLWLGGFEDGLSGELPEGNAAYTLAAEYARKAIAAHGATPMTEAQWTDVKNGFNTVVPSWMLATICSSDTVISNLHNHPAHFAPELIAGYFPYVLVGVPNTWYDRLGAKDFRKKLIIGPETTYAEFAPYTSMEQSEWNALPPHTFFKYRPAAGNRTDNMAAAAVSLPLMRVEEMYFIEMEAEYHVNGDVAAASKLEEFMVAYRDPQFKFLSNNYLDEIIFHKSVEFWGEGIVMFDMKRNNLPVKSKYDGSNFDPRSQFNTTGRVAWWNYCLPQTETDLNAGITKNNPNPSYAITFETVR